MHLKSISVAKLHGALTLDIDFYPDVTLLVGINGSGKTSALNCIEVLLRPDLRRLATLEYERLALTFQAQESEYVLTAFKNSKRVTLSIAGTSNKLDPIAIDLIQDIDPDDDEATEQYARLSPEMHERPMWEFLKSLPRPIVITLDRTIAAETDELIFFEGNRPVATRRTRLRSPLAYVQDVTAAAYAAYRKRAIAADDELKSEIVMSALQEPDFLSGGKSAKPLTNAELSRLEEKVVLYLSNTVKTTDVARQVRSFFQVNSQLASRPIREKLQQDLVLDILGSRYRQIESLAKAFNNYEKKNAAAFRKLNDYLETINQFFRDSNKELFFEESTGRLVFSFLRDGERTETRRGVKHLSSGERQLLILFSFLAFASTRSTVFIIDEPELSLHPKWQNEFMDAFLRLKPKGAQLLLATHSPEIVGKHRSSCISLRRKGN